MKRYVVLEKSVGETPLQCAEAWRAKKPDYAGVPLAYAGRLDPMASGKLLILIDDECKRQEQYHDLDKSYRFEVLFGVGSDTADVLGLFKSAVVSNITKAKLDNICRKLTGDIELPYPQFSAKTVQGKPLHVWTLEGRLGEITIPTKQSTIHKLKLDNLRVESAETIYQTASAKIETIAPVTEASKALGNDFRRVDVRTAWAEFLENNHGQSFPIATFSCTASSGTYMRTLAEVIARQCHTSGLAYSIHRTQIGRFQPLPLGLGVWLKKF